MNNLKLFLIEYWYPKNRTDGDLAEMMSVDKSLISKWLSGTAEPPLERKIQLAKALGIDSRMIFPETKQKDSV